MQYFNLHTHHFTDQEPVVELVNQYPWEFDERIKHTLIGIHPWYIKLERIASDIVIEQQKFSILALQGMRT
jgi:TatD DNase family protein